jgi:cytochrome P450
MSVPPDLPLNDPAFYASDPFDTYRRLRDENPLYWCAPAGFWALTRYDDVLAVSKDPATFCNGHGMTMRGGELDDVKGGETLITMDPPQHTTQRSLVNRSFTPGATSKLEPHIRDLASAILDEVPTGEPIDFVEAVAARLPVVVIAELLGVPVEDRDKFVAWSNASIGTIDPEFAHLRETAMLEQYEYFEDIIERRRLEPRRDLLSALVQAEGVSEHFMHADLLTLCFLLLAAGNETTRNLISHSFVNLVRYPDQQAALRDGGDTRVAIEELLRCVSPAIHMARTVTTEVQLHGQQLNPGEQVVMLYGAANRDERVFGDTAEELRLDRDPNPHLAFGFGEHFCLGSALARLEARVLLEELMDRFSDWQVAGPVEPMRSTMIRGIKHLPAALDTARLA